jgi:hypothetical protein
MTDGDDKGCYVCHPCRRIGEIVGSKLHGIELSLLGTDTSEAQARSPILERTMICRAT